MKNYILEGIAFFFFLKSHKHIHRLRIFSIDFSNESNYYLNNLISVQTVNKNLLTNIKHNFRILL